MQALTLSTASSDLTESTLTRVTVMKTVRYIKTLQLHTAPTHNTICPYATTAGAMTVSRYLLAQEKLKTESLLLLRTSKHFKSGSRFATRATTKLLHCVPLAIEPGLSLIILTPMKILQRNLNRSTFVVWEMKRNVSVVCVIQRRLVFGVGCPGGT